MLAHDADGSRTAYLPGGNELTLSATGSKTAVRYYTHGGETVAVRTGSGINFLFGDQQGTALIAVAWGAGQAVTRRKQLPFGGQRSSTGVNWPGDRGFVGGIQDPTDLTHLGAREYDPQLGRFLSVDPLLITDDPAQHNPYIYGNNNPATFADPTGEAFPECRSGQYVCNGSGTDVIDYGKNYVQITEGQGGTVSPGYVKQQNQYRYTCSKDPDCAAASAKARAEADRKAAEAQRKQNEKQAGFWGSIRNGVSKAWNATASAISDNWDEIKLGLTIGGFAACVVVSAGLCTGIGVIAATIMYYGDRKKTGEPFDWGAYGKTLAWTVAGGAVAGGVARALGTPWTGAFTANAVERATVRVPLYRTKMGYGSGPGGGRRGWVSQPVKMVDPSRSAVNMGINAQLALGILWCRKCQRAGREGVLSEVTGKVLVESREVVLRRRSWRWFFWGGLALVWLMFTDVALSAFQAASYGDVSNSVAAAFGITSVMRRLGSCRVTLLADALRIDNPLKSYLIPYGSVLEVSEVPTGGLSVKVDGGEEYAAFAFGGSFVDMVFRTTGKAAVEINKRLPPRRGRSVGQGVVVANIRRCWSADISAGLAAVGALSAVIL
ncbi:RHS repeat-associated core domain-containing protein [Streptomyces sp. NPDC101132]|uniref:RHS repeat-associated core domain-containing protein n=1 Tax=Streptomyces sp. NPDC101132 TaxID=3366110 RepID=UPI0037F17982